MLKENEEPFLILRGRKGNTMIGVHKDIDEGILKRLEMYQIMCKEMQSLMGIPTSRMGSVEDTKDTHSGV
jgi:hypothetical protein